MTAQFLHDNACVKHFRNVASSLYNRVRESHVTQYESRRWFFRERTAGSSWTTMDSSMKMYGARKDSVHRITRIFGDPGVPSEKSFVVLFEHSARYVKCKETSFLRPGLLLYCIKNRKWFPTPRASSLPWCIHRIEDNRVPLTNRFRNASP